MAAYQKHESDHPIFAGPVAAGGEFVVSGEDGKDKNGTLGTEISIWVDGTLHTTIHTSCSQPIGPGLVAGDFEVVEGYSRNGGLLCPLPPTEPPADECSECDGQVTQLTLRDIGTVTDAHVQVDQKKGSKAVFNGTVQPGDTFTFTGTDKHGTLGTEISIKVNDTLNTKIHTSCSQPIGPGLMAGDFEVVEAYSRNGGLICPLN